MPFFCCYVVCPPGKACVDTNDLGPFIRETVVYLLFLYDVDSDTNNNTNNSTTSSSNINW